MKYFKTLAFLSIVTCLSIYSCNDSTKAPNEDTTTSDSKEIKDVSTEPAKVTPPLKEPAQNSAGVWHYTCRIGCPGGSGTADKCKTCGNILIHNTTYHSNTTNAANAGNTTASPMVNPSATPPKPEPAQNAAGVWHYTCSKGCAGGSGAAGTCNTCSGPLAHNSAYH